jgi:hypothetical protein
MCDNAPSPKYFAALLCLHVAECLRDLQVQGYELSLFHSLDQSGLDIVHF